MSESGSGVVRILLATFNGAAFLPAQLASFRAQTYTDWTLLWRDDGSTDATRQIMAAFMAEVGADRCTRLDDPAGWLGVQGSYLALLRAVLPSLDEHDVVAFADQDDVWLPEKLERAMAALQAVPAEVPALACARQKLVDAALAPLGESPAITRPIGFASALAQNIATGCTIHVNRAAAQLIAASRPPAPTLHDWWSYLVVAASGGEVVVDCAPQVLYRQHGRNAVGAPDTILRRGIAAARRGPQAFMQVFRANLEALAAQPWLMTPEAAAQVALLRGALATGIGRRLGALRLAGLRRQTSLETLTFRLWFLLG